MRSANLYRSAAGSVPGERTKMRGVEGDDSLNTTDRSDVWGRSGGAAEGERDSQWRRENQDTW